MDVFHFHVFVQWIGGFVFLVAVLRKLIALHPAPTPSLSFYLKLQMFTLPQNVVYNITAIVLSIESHALSAMQRFSQTGYDDQKNGTSFLTNCTVI